MKKMPPFLNVVLIGALAASLLAACGSPEHRRTAGEYLDDQSINARVKASLLQDDDVAGLDVGTTTFDGVVQLSGFVATAEQRERAGEIARQVDGVQEVENNITVNPRAVENGGSGDASDPERDVEPDPPPLEQE